MDNEVLEINEPIQDNIESEVSSSLLSDEQFNELLNHIDNLGVSDEESSTEDIEESSTEDLEESSTQIIEVDTTSNVPDDFYNYVADTQGQTIFFLSLILGVLIALLFCIGLNSHKD